MILTKSNSSKQLMTEKLMKAVPFSASDLALNEDLKFSGDQKIKLKSKIDLYAFFSVAGTLVCFVVVFIFFMTEQDSSGFSILNFLILVGFGVFCYGIVWSLGLYKKLKKDFGIKIVEGTPALFFTQNDTNKDFPTYVLEINEIKFYINEETYNSFEKNDYRAYYFPLLFRNELLSIEPIVKE